MFRNVVVKFLAFLTFFAVCAQAEVEMSADGGNVILAKAGEFEVSKEDLLRYVTLRVPENRQAVYLSNPEHVRQAVQNILMIRVLAERGKNADVVVDVDQLEWEKQFNIANLYAQGYQDIQIEDAQKGMAWEARAKEIYIAEGERFVGKPKVDAAHILIKIGEERSPEAALALILNLKEQLDAGADFNALAKEYSEDPSAEHNAGELGEFTRDKMVKPFADAAFAMHAEGDVSDPVRSQFGYHLIKLNKKIEPVKMEFDSVKPNIVKSLQASTKKQVVDKILIELRSSLGMELNDKAIAVINKENDLLSR